MAVVQTIRSAIFGMEDGFVSIWGLVLGVSAGLHSSTAVIIAGLSGAVPAALSMAAGEYISSKSKREVQEKKIKDVRSFVRNDKAAAVKAIREHYKKEGLHEDEINILVRHLKKDEKLLERKLQEEHGTLPEFFEQPGVNAFVMFLSFVFASFFPIGPFLFLPIAEAQQTCLALTAVGLFTVGAAKTKWTGIPWWKSGSEMLLIGTVTAVAGYLIGLWLG